MKYKILIPELNNLKKVNQLIHLIQLNYQIEIIDYAPGYIILKPINHLQLDEIHKFIVQQGYFIDNIDEIATEMSAKSSAIVVFYVPNLINVNNSSSVTAFLLKNRNIYKVEFLISFNIIKVTYNDELLTIGEIHRLIENFGFYSVPFELSNYQDILLKFKKNFLIGSGIFLSSLAVDFFQWIYCSPLLLILFVLFPFRDKFMGDFVSIKNRKFSFFNIKSLILVICVLISVVSFFQPGLNLLVSVPVLIMYAFIINDFLNFKILKNYFPIDFFVNTPVYYEYSFKRNQQVRTGICSELTEEDIVEVKPGGYIPVDGKIIEGESLIDSRIVAYDQIRHKKRKDHLVYAGEKVIDGTIVVRVLRNFNNSIISNLFRNLSSYQQVSYWDYYPSKKILLWFLFFVLFLVMSHIVYSIIVAEFDFMVLFYKLIVFITIFQPDYLKIFRKILIILTVRKALSKGIIFRNSNALFQFGKNIKLFFSKHFVFQDNVEKPPELYPVAPLSKKELIQFAYSFSSISSDIYSKLIGQLAMEYKIKPYTLKNIVSKMNLGKKAELIDHNSDSHQIFYGNLLWIQKNGILRHPMISKAIHLQNQGKQIKIVARDNEILGLLAFDNVIHGDVVEIFGTLQKDYPIYVFMEHAMDAANALSRKVSQQKTIETSQLKSFLKDKDIICIYHHDISQIKKNIFNNTIIQFIGLNRIKSAMGDIIVVSKSKNRILEIMNLVSVFKTKYREIYSIVFCLLLISWFFLLIPVYHLYWVGIVGFFIVPYVFNRLIVSFNRTIRRS